MHSTSGKTSILQYKRKNNMGQSIPEWTKRILRKTALKIFEVSISLKQTISLQIFWRLSFTNFTWSIFEYFVPKFDSEDDAGR